jgi:ribosome-associated protein
MMDFELRGDHITLDALLKATGMAHSGGAAKVLIAAGQVSVDGAPELRRGRKLRAGCVVKLDDSSVRVVAPASGLLMPSGAHSAPSSSNAASTGAPTKTNPSAP